MSSHLSRAPDLMEQRVVQWGIYVIDLHGGVITGPQGVVNGRKGSYVRLRDPDNRGKTVSAHRVIWEAANGPVPAGMQINHINGNKSDNRLANLEVVTPSENTAHAYRLGLRSAKGESNGRAKLTADQVREIRASGLSSNAIARQLGVAGTFVRAIRRGEYWKGV